LSKPAVQRWLELLSRLSLRGQYRLGRLLALLLRITPNQISRQTRRNIELCFGGLDRGARQRMYRESIDHTCYSMIELAAVWCWPVERVLEKITLLDVCEEFDRGSRARIILAPHIGSWEMLAVWLGRHCKAIMLYKQRKRKHRVTDRFILEARSRSGGSLVPTRKQGLRQLLSGLKQGRSLLILPDQRPGKGKGSIPSTFFGHSALTTTLVQGLCSRIDCDVFIACASRSDPAGEFALRIRPLEHARLAADEADSAQYMNDQIEALVRLKPAQYQWGYRRFDRNVYATLQ
jgi:KDO2-lipid IV(A) lauroyltransferase